MWLDLSTGVNPWPWPIPADLPGVVWQRLPSRADEEALIAAARDAYSVPAAAEVVAAPGTQSLIQWLPQLASEGPVAIVEPTYNEHAAAWRMAGHEVIACAGLDDLPEGVRHAVVVNPNNPDGRVMSRAALARVAALLQQRGGWLVVDEAFADIEPETSVAGLCADLPVVILRSFGKFYGLAGLRLGFAIASPEIARRISLALGPWPCSGPALTIGAAALRDREWADRARLAIQREAGKVDAVLEAAGFTIVGGTGDCSTARAPAPTPARCTLRLPHGTSGAGVLTGPTISLRFGLPPDERDLERVSRIALASSKA